MTTSTWRKHPFSHGSTARPIHYLITLLFFTYFLSHLILLLHYTSAISAYPLHRLTLSHLYTYYLCLTLTFDALRLAVSSAPRRDPHPILRALAASSYRLHNTTLSFLSPLALSLLPSPCGPATAASTVVAAARALHSHRCVVHPLPSPQYDPAAFHCLRFRRPPGTPMPGLADLAVGSVALLATGLMLGLRQGWWGLAVAMAAQIAGNAAGARWKPAGFLLGGLWELVFAWGAVAAVMRL